MNSSTFGSSLGGIGTDIVYVSRIEAAFNRFGERFVQRILGAQEQQVFWQRYRRHSPRGILYLATRFAAKEAFSKAIGLGMRMPMAWSRAQILNARSGKPTIVLAPELQQWYGARFGAMHVSVTDESDLVMAYVIVEALT